MMSVIRGLDNVEIYEEIPCTLQSVLETEHMLLSGLFVKVPWSSPLVGQMFPFCRGLAYPLHSSSQLGNYMIS